MVPAKNYSGVMSPDAAGVPQYVPGRGWGVAGGCPQVGYDHRVPNGEDFWLNVAPWRVGFDAAGFADAQGEYYPPVAEWVRVRLRSLREGPPLPGGELFEDLQHQNDAWFRFKVRPEASAGDVHGAFRFELAFDHPATGEVNHWVERGFCYDFEVFSPIWRGIGADGAAGGWQHFRLPTVVPAMNLYRTEDGRPYRALFQLDAAELGRPTGTQPWKEVEIAQALPYTLEDRTDFWANELSVQQIPTVSIRQCVDLDGDGLPDHGGLATHPVYPESHGLVAWEITRTGSPARDVVLVTAGMHYEPPGNLVMEGFIREVLAHPEWLERLSFVFVPILNPDAYEWGVTHVAPYGNNALPGAPDTVCDLEGWTWQYDLERYGYGRLADPEARSLHAYFSNLTRQAGHRILAHLDLHADLCPHPNRWVDHEWQPPSIYGYIAYLEAQDRQRAEALVGLLAPSTGRPVPAWNQFSWPYYRSYETPAGWTSWAYAGAAHWESYFAHTAVPLHITFEYDELALYRAKGLAKPPWIETPVIEDHGGYAVDGYIDAVGRQVGGSDAYLFDRWGAELAQAVKRVFGPPKDLWEDWNTPANTNGWYQFTGGTVGSAIDWQAEGGVGNSAFAWSQLAGLEEWPPGLGLYYPLTAWAESHAIDLVSTPWVTVSIHAQPFAGGLAADLKGGSLRLFVGQWNADDEYAFYAFGGEDFRVGSGGWVRSTVGVSDRPEEWLLLQQPQPGKGRGIPLTSILPEPQQWGFVIIGAGSQPSGWLGFEDLRVTRRFGREGWNQPAAVNGWTRHTGALEEPPVAWSSTGGVADSGYAWTPLDELAEWVYTPGSRFPLAAYGGVRQQALHAVDLLERNVVTLSLNPACRVEGVPAPEADLKGGMLGFWVGRWTSETNHTFYRYLREPLLMGTGGWTGSRLTLTSHPVDWQLLSGVGPDRAAPLAEILADPQQWGIGLFGASTTPAGVLGFDRLSVVSQGHNWDREHDRDAWRYFGGADPGEPPVWHGQGGWGGSGYVACPLDALRSWEPTGSQRYYPLYTLAERQPVNLREMPAVRVALNRVPTGGPPADLRGMLTFFVGRWNDDARYAFYFFKQPVHLSATFGWFPAGLVLTSDPADWDAVGPGIPSVSLVALLERPQQWGFAVVDASGQPTGWLGFDELELHPAQAQALSARLVAETTLELAVSGSPHDGVPLESTTDLAGSRPWVPCAVVALDASGQGSWRERLGPDARQRFFRIQPEF